MTKDVTERQEEPVFSNRVMLFKSPIANMAGFLLWSIGRLRFSKPFQSNGYYSFIPAYSKKRDTTLIYMTLSKIIRRVDTFLFCKARSSPESPQACNPALGGYIVQDQLITSMQVPSRRKHATRHLGANASRFSNHDIINKTLLSQEDEPAFLHFSKSRPSTSY